MPNPRNETLAESLYAITRMNQECNYCKIPKRELNTDDYFEKMSLWRDYVNNGIFKFCGGDTPLETFEKEISKEEKYVYYHFFECTCGNKIRTGVCIRSSVPIIEYLESSNDFKNVKKKPNSINILLFILGVFLSGGVFIISIILASILNSRLPIFIAAGFIALSSYLVSKKKIKMLSLGLWIGFLPIILAILLFIIASSIH